MSKSPKAPGSRLWGGRFTDEPSVEMDRLNRSLPMDQRLWREDIAGSRAWATALGSAGVIDQPEARSLLSGLDSVEELLGNWDRGDWAAAEDEDIHSLVERLLRESVGAVAGKLHTGRSRNDQVATDTRLWACAAVGRLDGHLRALQTALADRAERVQEVVMPSYTHLQRAQPITAAHWLLSHAWPLARDRARLADACERVSVLPLGSGAISGCPFPVDRLLLRETLGFRSVSANSLDAVGDRDWVAELLFVGASIGIHLSRLAEDVIIFSSTEFGLVRMSDRFSTGSSLMPQKRNPDAMELARGKAGRLSGNLTSILSILKGLPSGYNKDLQEDKEILFDSFDTLETLLPAVTGTVETLEVVQDRCAAAIDPGMLATELADFLVRKGVPFREAHEKVGALVRSAESSGRALDRLPAAAYVEVAAEFEGTSIADLFSVSRALASRASPGGTAPAAVRDQLDCLRAQI